MEENSKSKLRFVDETILSSAPPSIFLLNFPFLLLVLKKAINVWPTKMQNIPG